MTVPVLESAMAILGSVLMLIASIGIVRMPDLLLRLQVTSKASALGLICILLAVALHFGNPVVTIRVAVIVSFIVLTIPIATHMLARAGYTTNVPLSDETVVNELIGQYDPEKHMLGGEEPGSWEFEIPPASSAVGRALAELGLPEDVLVLSIVRGSEVIVPRGQIVLEAHDALKIMALSDQLNDLRAIFAGPSPLRFQRVQDGS